MINLANYNQSNLYYQDPRYDRSERAVGWDLRLAPQGDLVVTDTGDLATISHDEAIATALLRRVSTPPAGYRRWVRTTAGLVELDPTYGDDLFLYQSAPIETVNLERMRQVVKRSAEADPRITVRRVDIEASPRDRRVNIVVSYTIGSESELRELKTTLGSI